MALSSSSSKSLPPPTPPRQTALFTPIQECEREEQEGGAPSLNKDKGLTPKHLSTPPNDKNIGKPNAMKRRESGGGWDGSEASRLKYSMAELEKKLNKLEVYCHNLKSSLDECNINSPYRIDKMHSIHQVKNQDGVVGANEKAWPEPLLQAFLVRQRVWLVHLLANSVHPGLPTFRVDKGVKFDSVYMEETDGERARNLVPRRVRIMITPGFYVYGTVVKCKVICSYANNMV
ncbi:Sec1/munc18-like (SM) proteins superfamily isoform 1 [Hibiscus syriacus]|uniref:Sec1/munc18-like (SM) proteins superfamily isoform 1 n=1 Tax=Hibiscus syriacus TaxID=106335 RepID=A0A6A2ZUN0_HIBSY|nr:Sec1/munc18-like (SM) proteins superfamily isoform 1 [Hibiscus syriacus]